MTQPSPTADAPGAARDHGFHPLRVAAVVRETEDASSFVLEVPDELRDTFAYRAGQFCTFRVRLEGRTLHRCYSMSSAPAVDDELTVTVKRVPDGAVSNWMNDALAPGATVEVSPPSGQFCLSEGTGTVVAFGAGSGITPVFSIVKAALATTDRSVRLLYANRDPASVIFADAVDELAARHPDRLVVTHRLDVESGYLDPAAVGRVLDGAVAPEVYVCGPGPFMQLVESTLLARGIGADHVHVERFSVEDLPGAEPATPTEEPGAIRVTVELDGRVDTADHRPGTTILQTARQMGMAPPFSCEMGNCATCMARLLEGEVVMHANTVLADDEVADGWVLTCQSVPTTPSVHIAYEES